MNRVVVPARQATQPGGIGSLESFLVLLKSLKKSDSAGYIGWWNRFLGSLNVYKFGLRVPQLLALRLVLCLMH
jgi:hypothetical protein